MEIMSNFINVHFSQNAVKITGKFQPLTCHESPEGESKHSCTLSLTSTLCWWAVNATPSRFTPGNDPVPSVLEAGWAPEPFWTGEENLATTGI